MAISRTEAALYAYITGRVLPTKTTRTAFKALVGTAIRAAQIATPRLAAAMDQLLQEFLQYLELLSLVLH